MKPTNRFRICCSPLQETLQQWWEKELSDLTVWGGGTGINEMPPENKIRGEWRDVPRVAYGTDTAPE